LEGGGVEDVKEGGGEGGLEICEAGVDDNCDEVWGLLVTEVGRGGGGRLTCRAGVGGDGGEDKVQEEY